MNNTLAILICHMPERASLLTKLRDHLRHQQLKAFTMAYEVNTYISPDMTISVGAKRQRLLEQCHEDYVAFIDDDDWVADDYVEQIMGLIQTNVDVVGFEGRLHHGLRTGPGSIEPFHHSIKHLTWWEEPHSLGGKQYYRHPNHLNPVRRELALATGYLDMVRSEDHDYSKRIQPLLKTEAMFKGVMYYYRTV